MRNRTNMGKTERTYTKRSNSLPKEKNTTEQVICMKLLIEKTITSENYTLITMMIDMSKAFDTVNRMILVEKLETTSIGS